MPTTTKTLTRPLPLRGNLGWLAGEPEATIAIATPAPRAELIAYLAEFGIHAEPASYDDDEHEWVVFSLHLDAHADLLDYIEQDLDAIIVVAP